MDVRQLRIAPEILIEEVRQRPALYNNNPKEDKEPIWNEVSENIISNWDELSADQKSHMCKLIKTKWKNHRDSFRKEHELQKKNESADDRTANKKRRRKYMYYDQLSFLISVMDDPVTEAPSKGTTSSNRRRSISTSHLDESVDDAEGSSDGSGLNKPVVFRNNQKIKLDLKPKENPQQSSNYEQSLINILSTLQNKDIDEDESFMLSLLPSFRRFDEEQKHFAKIEILNAIRRIKLRKYNAKKE